MIAAIDTTLEIFTDGGARGNPGPAACAFYAVYPRQSDPLATGSLFLGPATNNVAEYQAVILALNWLVGSTYPQLQSISFFSDSQLIVNQINGLFKIKDLHLKDLHNQVIHLISLIKNKYQIKINFSYIPRSQNYQADLLVNQTLDT